MLLVSDAAMWGCVQAFLEIETRMVSENIFSQFMYKTLANSCHVWTFKKQFCAQMALSGAGPCPVFGCVLQVRLSDATLDVQHPWHLSTL